MFEMSHLTFLRSWKDVEHIEVSVNRFPTEHSALANQLGHAHWGDTLRCQGHDLLVLSELDRFEREVNASWHFTS